VAFGGVFSRPGDLCDQVTCEIRYYKNVCLAIRGTSRPQHPTSLAHSDRRYDWTVRAVGRECHGSPRKRNWAWSDITSYIVNNSGTCPPLTHRNACALCGILRSKINTNRSNHPATHPIVRGVAGYRVLCDCGCLSM